MAVLLLLVVLLAQFLTYATGAWSWADANKERMQTARAISDYIGNELQGALLPINREDTRNLQFLVNSPGSGTSGDLTEYRNRDFVFWQAPSNSTGADVAEIGYFVQWDSSDPGNPHSQLRRFFARSDEMQIYSKPLEWLTETVIKDIAPANSLFADNVFGLWVHCLDPYGQQIIQAGIDADSFDSRIDYSYQDPSEPSQTVVRAHCSLPTSVDLSFVLLDSHAARSVDSKNKEVISVRLRSSADAAKFVTTSHADPDLRGIQSGLRAYSTRVYLQNSK